jgi:hypothetical protein
MLVPLLSLPCPASEDFEKLCPVKPSDHSFDRGSFESKGILGLSYSESKRLTN